MMKAIWKYKVEPLTAVEMPEGAVILTAQTQGEYIQMWALVDPDAPKEMRTFHAVPTGKFFDATDMTYIATFQVEWMVFHLFESKRAGER